MHDYRQADLSARERALCDFAVKLTHLAAGVNQADIDALRAQGLEDAAISDAKNEPSEAPLIRRTTSPTR